MSLATDLLTAALNRPANWPKLREFAEASDCPVVSVNWTKRARAIRVLVCVKQCRCRLFHAAKASDHYWTFEVEVTTDKEAARLNTSTARLERLACEAIKNRVWEDRLGRL